MRTRVLVVIQVAKLWTRLRRAFAGAAGSRSARGRRNAPLGWRNPAWRAAFDQSPQASLVADALNLQVVAANTELQRSLAMSEGQLTALTLVELFLSDGDPAVIGATLRNPNPNSPLLIRQTLNDHHIEIELKGYAVACEDGQFLIYTAVDVTERSAFQAALVENC